MHETEGAVNGISRETDGRLYTIPEAMGILHIGRAKIFRLISNGELGSEKRGRRRFISSEAINEYRTGNVTVALYTSAHVAQLLQVDEGWLVGQADADAVAHTRLGDGQIRFTQRQIDDILAAAERRPAPSLKTA